VKVNERYESALIELLSVYAQIDFLAMEVCAQRMLKEEDREAKLNMALQVEEERNHYLLQQERLAEMGVALEDKMPPELYDRVRDELAGMDWFDFLTSLQLVIEGVGIAAVEKVYEKADPRTKRALDLPINEENRQTRYAIEEIKSMLESAPPHERAKLEQRVVNKITDMREYWWALPMNFGELWEGVGLSTEEIREACYKRAENICGKLGFTLNVESLAA
jgi:hypothetical protein